MFPEEYIANNLNDSLSAYPLNGEWAAAAASNISMMGLFIDLGFFLLALSVIVLIFKALKS